jgi:TRAP-type C4-dicarboxylate transport system permease large subunit
MSSDAAACPHCGKPNTVVAKKQRDSKQNLGCVLMIVALLVGFLVPPVGVVMFVVGLVLVLLNMRVK